MNQVPEEPVTCAAFDFGGNFGYAVGRGGKILECGTADLQRRAKQLRCSRGTAADYFVRELFKRHDVAAVCWENSVAAFSGSIRHVRKKFSDEKKLDLGPALIQHAGYEMVVTILAERRGIKIIPPIANTALKKFATGNGKADKPEMIRWAKMLHPSFDFGDDDNMADAAHVCAWAMLQVKQAGRLPF